MKLFRRFQPVHVPVAPTLLVTLVGVLLGACRSQLPTYPPSDAPESLRVIAERLASVKSIQSRAAVNFEDVDGVGVHLDAALVAEPPGRLRLRAWKLDHAVFDSTLIDGEMWMLPPENQRRQGQADDSRRAAEGIRRALSLLGPDFYKSARVDGIRTTGRQLVVLGEADGYTIRCEIDRETLTPRRFDRPEDENGAVFSIELEDYRLVDTIVWPGTWVISHAGGRVVIRMNDVVLNAPVPPEAFVPPRRAVRNP